MYASKCYHARDLELFSGEFSIPVEGRENETLVILCNAASAKMQAPGNVFTAVVMLSTVSHLMKRHLWK